ncbi:MAG: 50S ribosomal protein L6 [Candidatus Omnitrophica bacterium]|nr:50S ribosomal protein L6 [Candidatus Omnitrophota bacterium]
MSRIGKKPVAIPQGVKVEVKDAKVFVEGPKGKLDYAFSYRINVAVKDNQVIVTRNQDTKLDRALHGLTRALINNMIKGVVDGYTKEMEIIGVGFKAQVQGNNLNLLLGFSHPVDFPIPEGIKIEAPKPTQLVIRGIDKEKVGETAAKIRAFYPPEPYKGKGIRFAGEYIKKKVGKAAAATAK